VAERRRAMTNEEYGVRWRASGPYLASNSSKAGLLDEAREFLLEYGRLGDIQATTTELVNGKLPQRSRTTREVIVSVLKRRLISWRPPNWVLQDLIHFAQDQDELRAALLLHVVREDRLLYDFVQDVIVPYSVEGIRDIVRGDVQRYLDQKQVEHPEVGRWSFETREKLAGNVLSILRDYGLLKGKALKQIVDPLVPSSVAKHLVRLLQEEGVPDNELIHHPDWHIWLWNARRAYEAVESVAHLDETAV
jgi:Putative inner membrane protein (DUF1819)